MKIWGSSQRIQKIITKLFRDNEKCWEELKELKSNIITKIKQVQTELLGLKNTVESLTMEWMLQKKEHQKWTVTKWRAHNGLGIWKKI